MGGWLEAVDGYVEHKQLLGQWRPLSAQKCRQVLVQFVREVDVCRLDEASLGGWVNQAGFAAGTRINRWTITRGFLAWAGVDVSVPSPPQPRSTPRPLRDVDVSALLAECDLRDEVFVSLAVCEGLRTGEIHRLDVGDVDIGGRTVFVVGKGGHQRWVPLTEASAARICRYCDGPRGWRPGALVAKDEQGSRVSHSWFGNRARKLMTAAGIKRPGVNLHALRHTAATRLWMETSDLFMTQQLLGHTNVATTARYVASRPTGAMRDAMNRVSS